jgi:hypothetical protein
MPDIKSVMPFKPLTILALSLLLAGCATLSPPAADKNLRISIASPLQANNANLQNIGSFDVYLDRQTVHAVFTAASSTAKLPLIGYLHSEDGGQHWSEPQLLSTTFSLPVESKSGNDIQIAASGKSLLALWQTTGEMPGMGPLLMIFSQDGGKTWQKGANPTGSDTDQSHPDLAADPEGRFHLVWLDDREENGYQGLRYARTSDVGQSWELAHTIDTSTCSCCWNRIVVSADKLINVLYRDMQPRDMALAQSSDAGASWRRQSTVGEFNWQFDGCPHNGGGLTQAGNGDLHSLVWTGAENRVGLYHLQSADGGKNWPQPQAFGAGTTGFHSDIAALDANRLAAVWDASGPEGSSVYLAMSTNNGGDWSAAQQISSPGVSAAFPRIIATDSGWLALWTEQKSKNSKQWLSAVIQ